MNLPNSDQTPSQLPHDLSQTDGRITFKAVGVDIEQVSLIQQLPPGFLAYLGDAVYELYVRTHYLLPPRRLADYHNQVVSLVRAESQAAFLERLNPYLTETEQEVVRRGRNAATGKPRRLSPELYQQATSLETLIGYLYLHNPQRLNQLLEKLNLAQIY